MKQDCKKLWTIYLIMFKIGALTFGGGWSIITQVQEEFVEKRKWMGEEQIMDYMSLRLPRGGGCGLRPCLACYSGHSPCSPVLRFHQKQPVCGTDIKWNPKRRNPHHPSGCLETEIPGHNP